MSHTEKERVGRAVGFLLFKTGINGGLSVDALSSMTLLQKFQGSADGAGNSSAPELSSVIDAAYEHGKMAASGMNIAGVKAAVPEDCYISSSHWLVGACVVGAAYLKQHESLQEYPLARSQYDLYRNAAELAFVIGASGVLDKMADEHGAPLPALEQFSAAQMWVADARDGAVKLLPVKQTNWDSLRRDVLEFCYNDKRIPPRLYGSVPEVPVFYFREAKKGCLYTPQEITRKATGNLTLKAA